MAKIKISLHKGELEAHIQRVCRPNLRRSNIKCCHSCPWLGPILDIMDENDWNYKRELYAEDRKKYNRTHDYGWVDE